MRRSHTESSTSVYFKKYLNLYTFIHSFDDLTFVAAAGRHQVHNVFPSVSVSTLLCNLVHVSSSTSALQWYYILTLYRVIYLLLLCFTWCCETFFFEDFAEINEKRQAKRT